MNKTLLLLFISQLLLFGAKVTDYRPNLFCYGTQVNLRSFLLDGNSMQLSLDARTLHASIHTPVKTIGSTCNRPVYRLQRYFQLLDRANTAPYPLQNDGITQAERGIAITTDLCPSSKQGFERRLYEALMERFSPSAPVTLFITGKWIKKHTEAFAQLLAWEKAHKLSITWGNHTYSHPYHPNIPLKENFALSKDYTLKNDTLRLEKELIERGVTPSVFFRFPGLVSDQKSMQTIHDLGLIVIGSNTWIAKGEKPKEGSIILLHGNKNEAKGVEMFLKMLKQRKIQKISSLQKSLYPPQ